MKRIRRLNGPIPGLAAYLAHAGGQATWRGYSRSRGKTGAARYQKLMKALTDLQHGLCGYCEIDLREDDRQVEHVVPQSDPQHGADRALDAANMIACCRGGTAVSQNARGQTPAPRSPSCGQAKGNSTDPSFIDPRILPALPSLTRVLSDGRIEADANACKQTGFSVDRVDRTIDILGLNVKRLRRAREGIWNDLNDSWQKHHADSDVMEKAARMELLPDGDGKLPSFFTTVRSYFSPLSESILAEQPQTWI